MNLSGRRVSISFSNSFQELCCALRRFVLFYFGVFDKLTEGGEFRFSFGSARATTTASPEPAAPKLLRGQVKGQTREEGANFLAKAGVMAESFGTYFLFLCE